ncbi:Crp/Fnr family transcriptional regulator [Larkinella soli]|uniref:Crp/Fnr family transcriptional regulator n=1 Tax=Larkinella soli TaxID=1770527 RepID=UPI000FFC4656|nr:Crp/Fnr family transcriptional regulator [Larkinella soli]
MNDLSAFLEENGFSAEDRETILGAFLPLSFRKGDYFLQEGQTTRKIGYVRKGVFQYFYNHDGDEITTYIASPGGFVVSLGSFLQQMPARENIRALTEADLLVISKERFDQLRAENDRFQAFYVGLLESQMVCIDDSRFNLITLTAEERYQKLLTEEPQLLQLVPQHYLASILGVTPRHLSRIRKQVR